MTRSLRRGSRGVAIGVIAMLSASLLWTGSAIADPDNPATCRRGAAAPTLDSSHRAGALNEEVLVAQEKEAAATAAASAAGEQVGATTAAAAAARTQAEQADQAAASYQGKVNAFANASFRGARLDGVSRDADGGLGRGLPGPGDLAGPGGRRHPADPGPGHRRPGRGRPGQAQADAAATAAAAAKAEADAAAGQPPQQATADVTARKAELDAEAARYKALYDSLSEQERQAAAAAEEQANAAANARRRADPPAAAPSRPRAGPIAHRLRRHRPPRPAQESAPSAPGRQRCRRRGGRRRPVQGRLGLRLRRGRSERLRLLGPDVLGVGAGRREHPADLRRAGRAAVGPAERAAAG